MPKTEANTENYTILCELIFCKDFDTKQNFRRGQVAILMRLPEAETNEEGLELGKRNWN